MIKPEEKAPARALLGSLSERHPLPLLQVATVVLPFVLIPCALTILPEKCRDILLFLVKLSLVTHHSSRPNKDLLLSLV